MTTPQTDNGDIEQRQVGEAVELTQHEPRSFDTLDPDTGAPAKAAVEPRGADDAKVETPHARVAEPLPQDAKPDQLAHKEEQAEDRQEALLDEGVEESFPASDPVSAKRIT